MEGIIGAAIGAAIAVLGGWFGAATQSRREHAAWLRDRRADALILLQTVVAGLDVAAGDLLDAQSRSEEPGLSRRDNELLDEELSGSRKRLLALSDRLIDASSRIAVLGPRGVVDLATAVTRAPRGSEERSVALDRLVAAYAEVLRLPEEKPGWRDRLLSAWRIPSR